MALSEKIKNVIALPVWRNNYMLAGLWIVIGIVAAISKQHHHNNYEIFCGVFNHTIRQVSLYAEYPTEYLDVNHYGPLFSIIIAPFALLPDGIGLIIWDLCLAILLTWAVFCYCKTVDCRPWQSAENTPSHNALYTKVFIIWFCAHELLIALFMQQYNVAIAAGMIMTYYCVEKEQDFWAAFWIMLGTFVKLYGIVGLAFFLFSRHKVRFIISCIFWAAVMFGLPMIFSSPEYITGQYKEWFYCLLHKNDVNINGDNGLSTRDSMTNISLLGIVRRVTLGDYSDLWLIIPGCMLFAAPYLRFAQWKNVAFRQTILASAMMFLCLFSTGTESSGYITALAGCCIWYCCAPWQRGKTDVYLMIFAFILTSLSMSDIFPHYLRDKWCKPFALKALPVSIIWFKLCYELLTKEYKTRTIPTLA